MFDRTMTPAGPHRRVSLVDLEPGADDFLAAAIKGLSRPDKALPYRFLYDARGSALFDRITQLAEYYPTRTEVGILRDNAGDIARRVGPAAQLVEPGSGSSRKVRILLDALDQPFGYVPIDISRDHLLAAAQRLQDEYPELKVEAICADFAQDFVLPPKGPGARAGFYPGSTIGNLAPAEAGLWLAQWARRLGAGAMLLIGVDLQKPAAIVEPAYDDSQGVTAAFTLNLLERANRELGADFDISAFRHEADYLPDEGRVRIRLRSLRDQRVRIGGRVFELPAGETIHVEDSWKYTVEGFHALARRTGFDVLEVWTDPDRLFSVHLLEARS